MVSKPPWTRLTVDIIRGREQAMYIKYIYIWQNSSNIISFIIWHVLIKEYSRTAPRLRQSFWRLYTLFAGYTPHLKGTQYGFLYCLLVGSHLCEKLGGRGGTIDTKECVQRWLGSKRDWESHRIFPVRYILSLHSGAKVIFFLLY